MKHLQGLELDSVDLKEVRDSNKERILKSQTSPLATIKGAMSESVSFFDRTQNLYTILGSSLQCRVLFNNRVSKNETP